MSSKVAAAPTAELSKRQLRLTFLGLILAVLLAALDQTIVATALPTIVGDLNGLQHISWVITAYILAATIGLPIYGKLGDLFGRKYVFLVAIGIFLLGSVLSGLAQNMTQLIAFRAVQGLGGGGLFIGAQAIIGDVVSPRDRGRYMGLIGAAFAVASVSGPLIGGFITDYWDWRWIFYINLPLGALAIAVIMTSLHTPRPEPRRVRLDYLGTVLLAVASAAIVLLTSWGGMTYAWNSPVILGLGGIALVAAALFVLVERKAAEPIMPLTLFRTRNFTLATLIGISIGIAMFSTIAYMPTFLQMVNGATATGSGLMMLPMTAGLLIASIGTGQLISRTGRYKVYPIIGPVLVLAGLLLLSRISDGTPYWFTAVGMLVIGLGVGCVMQNLVLIVQNSVPRAVMGTATSTTNYFRQIAATFGISLFGSIFISRLAEQLPSGAGAPVRDINAISPAVLRALPAGARDAIAHAFAVALPPVFLIGVPIIVVAFVLAFFIQEIPLSDTPGAATPGAGAPGA